MATLFIPALLRPACGGNSVVEADGRNVAAVVAAIDDQFPGFRDRIVSGDALRPDLAVAVDGHIDPLGLAAAVRADSEINLLPAVQGG